MSSDHRDERKISRTGSTHFENGWRSMSANKILDFRWSKKAKLTL